MKLKEIIRGEGVSAYKKLIQQSSVTASGGRSLRPRCTWIGTEEDRTREGQVELLAVPSWDSQPEMRFLEYVDPLNQYMLFDSSR